MAAIAATTLMTQTPAMASPPPSSVSEYQPEVPTKYGGRTVGGDVSPANPALVLAATDSGGIFRSTDSGAHWSHVDTLVPFRMEDIKFAPNNPSVVLATTAATGDTANKGGIWRSTDAGVNWTRATINGSTCPGDSGDFDAWGIAFEASTTNVYVGTNCGLMVSSDQGGSFTRTAGSKILSVSARTGGQIDGCATGGHVRYTNSGGTLTLTSGPTPIPAGTGGAGQGCGEGYNGATTHNMATAPQEGNVVFAMSPGSSTSLCGGTVPKPAGVFFLMESDDGGANWTQVGASCPSRQPWVYTRVVHDGNPDHFAIYFSGGLDVSRGTCTANVVGSRCTGLPSGSANVGQGHADPAGMAFATDGTDCAAYKYGDGGMENTGDCGANFAMVAGSGTSGGGFNALQVYEIKGQIHPGHTDLWFGTQDNSLYASQDNGVTWPNNICCEGYDFQALRSTPSDAGQRLTFMTCGDCVIEQANVHFGSVAGWNSPPGTNAGSPGGNPMLLPPQADTYVQWSMPSPGTNQLYLTTDAGSNWTAVSGVTTGNSLTGHPIVTGPAADPTIYQLTSGGLLKITGVNTANPAVVTTISTATISIGAANAGHASFRFGEPALGIDPNNPLTLLAADMNTNKMRFSHDGGATWTNDAALTALVTDNGRLGFSVPFVGSQVHTIAFDPVNANTILVGTELSGILASLDGGQTWARMPGSEKITAITSFFFDEVRHDILVSSYGRGLWKLAIPDADLSVTKTHTPATATAGAELDFNVTVTNNGPGAASSATVVDMLPAQLSFVADTLTPPEGCTATGQKVVCTLGPLASGESRSFTIRTLVAPDAVSSGGPTSVTNTISVTSPGANDPNPGNNTASDTFIIQDLADLEITKLCKPDTVVRAGQPIDCTIFVDNHGPSAARHVTVDDVMLSNGTFTVSNIVPGGCSLTSVTGGKKLTCDLGTIDAATSSVPGRATITYRVSSNEGQDLNNEATVRSDTPDPDASNNRVTVALTIQASADLQLTATAPASLIAGNGTGALTLTVTNNGPSTAANVVVADTVPAGVQIVSVTGSGGATCAAGAAGDPFQPATCGFGSLSPGASRTMTVTINVLEDTTGILHNSAGATSDTFDPNNANNLIHSDITVVVRSDLAATVAASPKPVIAGQTLTWRTTVSNNGPSTATGVSVAITLPGGVSFTKATVTGSTGTCGLLTPTSVGCALGTMVSGSSADVYVDALVAPSVPAGTVLTATSVVSSTSPDPVAGNNTASDSSTVATRADLKVVLTSDADVYKPSTVIHYTITVTNNGPSDAVNVVASQVLPPSKSGFYVSNDAGCPAPSGQTFTCSLGTLAAGGTRTIQVNFMIRGNKGTITSTASVTSGTPDPNTADNTSIRNVTVK
jgi:uncharacterized repeat protein (TIGR01451 family)